MIAVAVPFILTVIVGKRKGIGSVRAAETEISEKNDADSTEKAAEVKEITAFLSGKVIDITEVPDEVFSQKTLGDGVAIEPTDEVLVAPADAEVSIVMEGSNHACGLSLPNGMELLLHIGLDTVDMNGDGFTAHVKAGDKVKRGDRLISFDKKKILAAGHPATTMLVVTEEAEGVSLEFHTGIDVKAGQDAVISLK